MNRLSGQPFLTAADPNMPGHSSYSRGGEPFLRDGLFAELPAAKKSSVSYTSRALYLLMGPSFSQIINSEIYKDDRWTVNNGIGYSVEVGYLLKFNHYLGINVGLGYSSYSTEISLGRDTISIEDQVDKDDDVYVRKISSENLSEDVRISYVDLPFCIDVSNLNIDKLGLYIRFGVKLSVPLLTAFDATGKASYSGYYDQYNIELYGIPELDFTSGEEIYEDTELSLNTVNLSAIASAGITIPVSNYIIIRLGGNVCYGLTEISKHKEETYDQTYIDGNYSKLLENPDAPTQIRSYGAEVGLIYNLRLY